VARAVVGRLAARPDGSAADPSGRTDGELARDRRDRRRVEARHALGNVAVRDARQSLAHRGEGLEVTVGETFSQVGGALCDREGRIEPYLGVSHRDLYEQQVAVLDAI